ncbi:MAG: LiaI-LiaF-like domain-containing protein [Actinomycetota bacterium]
MNRGAFLAGLVFTIIGVFFLLERLDVWEIRGAYVWPVLLIVLGLVVLLTARRGRPEPPSA